MKNTREPRYICLTVKVQNQSNTISFEFIEFAFWQYRELIKFDRTVYLYEMILNECSALAPDISVFRILQNRARANSFASLGRCDKKQKRNSIVCVTKQNLHIKCIE